MQYKRFARTKSPRNKWGLINQTQTVINGSSSFGSSIGDQIYDNYNAILDALDTFHGATEYEDGKKGLVPAPLAGMQDYYFLKADGNWTYVPAYKWLHEWPDIGDPRGLELDGDFNVTGTINTMDLNVQGTAHFWELVIDRVKANGGQVIVSPSLFEVDWVGGTQIYEFGFNRNPFYWTSWNLSNVSIPTDITQWTGRENERNDWGDIIFYNTLETNFTKEQFTNYCYGHNKFLGTGVWYSYIGSETKGWGKQLTGYFDRDMRDENGELLPLTLGLPYDWDAHWMDYYRLELDCTQDLNSVMEDEITFTYSTQDTPTGYVYWKGRVMNPWTKTEFLSTTVFPNLLSDWVKIYEARPDIWYRFFADTLEPGFNPNQYPEFDTPSLVAVGCGTPAIDAEVWYNYSAIMYNPDGTPDVQVEYQCFYHPDTVKLYKNGNMVQFFAKRLWMRCDDGTRRTFNECEVGDMLRCRSFNIREGVYHNVSNKDFWTFVAAKGEGSYSDDDGNEFEAFYVDLVYALKLIQGDKYNYYPIGTLFNNVKSESGYNKTIFNWDTMQYESQVQYPYYCNPLDTEHGVDENIDYPQGWEQNMVSVLNLKKISRNMLCGLTVAVEEFPTDEEFEQAVDLISEIRGQDLFVQFLNGTTQTIGDTQTEEEANPEPDIVYTQDGLSTFGKMSKAKAVYAKVATGALPDNPSDLSQLIVNEQFNDEEDTNYSDSEIDDANALGFYILKGGMDGDDIAETDNSEKPDIVSPKQEELTKGRQAKLRETQHNYTTKEYYSSFKFGYGKWNVRTGDQFACLGNLYDKSRMNAIVISSVTPIDPELLPPSIAQYHMIDVFGASISKFRYTTIAKNGNNFFGQFNIDTGKGSYVDIDDTINLYITDIVTGLETVGIHLDGPNSTIKMIGNIELHQHDDGDDDTLSIWDSQERKRLEMIPREIPERSSEESLLSLKEHRYFKSEYTTWTAPTRYIYYEKTGSWLGGLWGNSRKANYTLNMPEPWDGSDTPRFDFSVLCTSSLGQFIKDNATDKCIIDINDISIKCDTSNTYLVYGGTIERNLARQLSIIDPEKRIRNMTLNIVAVTSSTRNVIATKTVTNPSYTLSNNETTYNITLPGIVFNDIEIEFPQISPLHSQEYVLEVTFDVRIFAQAQGLTRSDTRTFNGTAVTTGDFSLTVDRQDSEGESMNSNLSQMVIGTNGMVFNQSNSKYFYAADDGIEIKWDNTNITLDDDYGLRICPKVGDSVGDLNDKSISVAVASGGGIYLPNAADYGNGRKLTCIGATIIFSPRSQMYIRFSSALLVPSINLSFNEWVESPTWSTGSGNAPYDKILYAPSIGTVEFIAVNGVWYVLSGFIYGVPNIS